jgi:hypothetical protein
MASCRKEGWLNKFRSFPSCCRLVSNRPEVVTGPKGNPGLISRQSTTRSPVRYIYLLYVQSALLKALAAQRIFLLNNLLVKVEGKIIELLTFGHYPSSSFYLKTIFRRRGSLSPKRPETRTSSIDWAQLNRLSGDGDRVWSPKRCF